MGSSCLFLLCLAIAGSYARTESKFTSQSIARERLITDLFANYEASARPAPKGVRIDLHVHIALQHFSFRSKDGAFHFVGTLAVSWKDPKLKWQPQSHANLTRIKVNQKIVWVPDLEVYNTAPDAMIRMHRKGNVVLSHDGSIVWSDTLDVTIYCTTDMYDWPRDTHSCKLTLGSWTYDALDMDITNKNPNASMTFENVELHNTEYRIKNFTAMHVATIYSCCAEPYATIDYFIDFERRSNFIGIFRIFALCVVVLPVLALSLEVQRTEKILLNGIAFVVVVLHLLYFANQVGRFSRSTPSIVQFHICALLLITYTCLVSVFSLMATRSRIRGKLHARVCAFLDSTFVKIVSRDWHALDQVYKNDLDARFEEIKLHDCSSLLTECHTIDEWTRLAVFVERISLYALVPLYLVFTSSFFV